MAGTRAFCLTALPVIACLSLAIALAGAAPAGPDVPEPDGYRLDDYRSPVPQTLKGAKVIVCASAFLSPRFDHWEFFLRARATENQCWVVASGQVGKDPSSDYAFVGRSMVVDPWGVITATAPDTECCLTTTIDLDYIDVVKSRYPLMDQRRPELYQTIGQRKA